MDDDVRSMYELAFPEPSIDSPRQGPVLVVAMEGYADAGQGVETAADFLLAALDHTPLAVFNNDELIDYRSRRPRVSLSDSQIIAVDPLELSIQAVRDTRGQTFLLLSGPEPDLRWSAFSRAVADLVERFDVSQTLCLYSAAMAMPHTRPLVVSAHGYVPQMETKHFLLDAPLTIPGSAALSIEWELAQRGKNVGGLTAYVPHYAASSVYPESALRLLTSISQDGNISLPLQALAKDADRSYREVDAQFKDPEQRQLITALEEKYDQEIAEFRAKHPDAVAPGEGGLPSANQLGDEAESFLQHLPVHGVEGLVIDDDGSANQTDNSPRHRSDDTAVDFDDSVAEVNSPGAVTMDHHPARGDESTGDDEGHDQPITADSDVTDKRSAESDAVQDGNSDSRAAKSTIRSWIKSLLGNKDDDHNADD